MRFRSAPSLLVLCLPLAAQTAGTPPLPVVRESVVVTGSWEPVPLEEADRTIVSLPVRDRSLLLNSFVDALRLDPSLDLRQRAPNGLQGDVSIRGATFGQTLVLVNGRRMNDPQTGHHNLDLPVSLDNVEAVEVLRGSGSTLYGSDALGGVVNLITKPPEAGQIRLRAALGNFGVNQESVSLAGVKGRLAQQLFFSRDFSTGFIPNRDYRNLSAGSSTHFRSTAVDLAYSDKPFGAQGFYGPYPSWERTKSWFAGARQGLGERTDAALSWRRHTDLFYLFRNTPARYQNHHVAESWHASLRRRDPLAHSMTLFSGAEGFGDSIQSSNLGVHSRARGSAYLNFDARSLGRFSLSAGLRSESYRGAFDQLSPSLAAGFWVNPTFKLRAGASRAFRLPTFTDLYYRDPANAGNPLLNPERAWSYEAGAVWRPAKAWRIETAVFRRKDRDVIDYARPVGTTMWQALNIQQIDFSGIETATALQLGAQMLEWSYSALRGNSAPLPGVESKYAFNYPVHSGVFSWTGRLPRQLIARTRVGALERRGGSPYALWELYGARSFGRIRPFVQFTNLANVRYQEIPGVPMPGRAIVGGVEVMIR